MDPEKNKNANYTKNVSICLSVVVAILTCIAFLPGLENGFVDWDDPAYLTENQDIFSLSSENIIKIFTSSYNASYVPLTLFTFALEYFFANLNPFLYHLTNLVLHILNTLLVFWFVSLIVGRTSWYVPGRAGLIIVPFLSALFFGIHPTRVDSVAWITERKDVLYTLFYFGSLIAYFYFQKKERNPLYYVISLFLFILSLFAKPMAVTLPVIFLLLDFFEKKHIGFRMIWEKAPFFALSLIFGIINLFVHFAADKGGVTAIGFANKESIKRKSEIT